MRLQQGAQRGPASHTPLQKPSWVWAARPPQQDVFGLQTNSCAKSEFSFSCTTVERTEKSGFPLWTNSECKGKQSSVQTARQRERWRVVCKYSQLSQPVSWPLPAGVQEPEAQRRSPSCQGASPGTKHPFHVVYVKKNLGFLIIFFSALFATHLPRTR